MAKVEDVMRKAKEAAEKANAKADPVVDSWLDKVKASRWTSIIITVAVLILLAIGSWLTR